MEAETERSWILMTHAGYLDVAHHESVINDRNEEREQEHSPCKENNDAQRDTVKLNRKGSDSAVSFFCEKHCYARTNLVSQLHVLLIML